MNKWIRFIGLVGGVSAVTIITSLFIRLQFNKSACIIEDSVFIRLFEIFISFFVLLILLVDLYSVLLNIPKKSIKGEEYGN